MQRLKKVQTADVSVYHVFEEGDNRFRGVASVQVQDSLTQPEMEKLFADAYYAAGFVKNKYYDLYEGTKVGMVQAKDPFGEKTLNEMVQGFAQALFAEDVYKEVFINSAEIFASRLTVHIRNSRGVDVSYNRSRVQGEFVVQCTSGQDVETYQDFSYNGWNLDAIREKARNTIELTRARARATTAPAAGEYRLILSGGYVNEFMSYYVNRASSFAIHQKYSTFSAGCDVQGGEIGRAHV